MRQLRLVTGCPRKGTKDYAHCKKCKDQKRKRDLEEREAKAKGGKGGGGRSKGGKSGGGKGDNCQIWR